MLKPEIKEKWVAALRSGEYKQGQGYLRQADNSFCCLGVLCDLHSKETGVDWEKDEDGTYTPYSYMSYLGAAGVPENTVRDWAGRPEFGHVIGFNDDGQSFSTIANYIEENL